MRKRIAVTLAIALLAILVVGIINSDDKTPAAKTTQLGITSYKDGSYRGSKAETLYGPVEVEIKIDGGRIVDVTYLEMPDDDARSSQITGFSSPALEENTLKAQSADIDFVTGATSTSYGYQQSLQAALDKAKGSAVNFRNIRA